MRSATCCSPHTQTFVRLKGTYAVSVIPVVMCCVVLCCAVPLLSTGVIRNADQPADKKPRLQGAAFNGPPTRILVLRNLVGPGEVDEDLEEEVSSSSSSVLHGGRLPTASRLLCVACSWCMIRKSCRRGICCVPT